MDSSEECGALKLTLLEVSLILQPPYRMAWCPSRPFSYLENPGWAFWLDSLKDSGNNLAWSGAVGWSLFLAVGLGSFSNWARCLLGAERHLWGAVSVSMRQLTGVAPNVTCGS